MLSICVQLCVVFSVGRFPILVYSAFAISIEMPAIVVLLFALSALLLEQHELAEANFNVKKVLWFFQKAIVLRKCIKVR